jgi:hypothetical protein
MRVSPQFGFSELRAILPRIEVQQEARVDMRTLGARLLAALFAAAAFVSTYGAWAQGQAEWHTMTGPNRSFTADIPTSPKYTATQMKTGVGAAYTMHQYITEVGEIAYVVQTVIYPGDVDVTKPQAYLQRALDSAAKNLDGGKWTSVEWTKWQGLSAADAIGVREGHAVRSFSTMKGRQFVTLTYAGPADSARSPDVERFVGSLRMGQ